MKSPIRALGQASAIARRAPRVATILVADDRAEARARLRLLLEEMGHAVMEASNVQQALALVRQCTPDMILSDIHFPGVDGFELCRRLQQDRQLRHVPLALMTEEFDGSDLQQFSQDVGAVAVLTKPVEPRQLRAVVDQWLSSGSVPDATQRLQRLKSESFHRRHSREVIARLERKVADLDQLSRRYKLLSETNHAIVRFKHCDELLSTICRVAVEVGGLRHAVVVLFDQATRRPASVVSYSGVAQLPVEPGSTPDEFAAEWRRLAEKTLEPGMLLVVNDVINDPRTVPLLEKGRSVGIGAMAVCPLSEAGVITGAIELYARESGFFTPGFLQTLEEMAEDIAFGLRNRARDIDHANALQHISDSLDYNRVLFESSPIGIITYRATGAAVFANAAAADLTGGTVAQLVSQNFRDITSWKSSGLLSLAEQALATNRATDGERHLQRTTFGRAVWIRARFIPFEHRSERHLLALLSDINERKQAEQALGDAEAKYRALVELQSLVGIYLVDGSKILYQNPRTDEIFGYDKGEMIGQAMRKYVVAKDWPVVERELRRVMTCEVSTVKVDFRGRRKDGGEVLISAQGSLGQHNGRPILIGVLQDVTDQRHAEQAIQLHVAQLEVAFMRTVEVATTLGEIRDPYTAGHERRVAEIAVAIGAELGFDARRQQGLRVAGNLHDVGKMSIPTEILSKPGKLSAVELLLVKGHAQTSYDILKNIEFPWPVAQVALQHHERMDGSGYPQGLKGEEIVLEARIMAVADVVEAMSSHRPYRAGLGIDRALAEIERGRGSVYDPAVVDACLKLFREQGYEVPNAG